MGVFFGTDGLRGKINRELTFDIAKKIGGALAIIKDNPSIIIGCDTRISNTFLTLGVAGGAVAGGANVVDIGIAPTASIAYVTKKLGFDFGVVISASHNSGEYNGIKIFGCDGYKLSEIEEEMLERALINEKVNEYPYIGKYEQDFNLLKLYKKHLLGLGEKLNGYKIVLDCAYGASYKTAPEIFKLLGAKVICENCQANGLKINEKCGALYPEILARKVLRYGADMGFCFDGDADRLIAITEKGEIFDGDKILYVMANYFNKMENRSIDTVVATSHTNMAIEKQLNKEGISLIRTDIGDKYVLAKMLEKNLCLGGEQSGHIILKDYATTGDGILSAIVLSNIVKNQGKTLSELADFELYPQVNSNIVVKDKFRIINNEKLSIELSKLNASLNKTGRVMVRASGTEPKIRVMVESPDGDKNKSICDKISNLVKEIEGNL